MRAPTVVVAALVVVLCSSCFGGGGRTSIMHVHGLARPLPDLFDDELRTNYVSLLDSGAIEIYRASSPMPHIFIDNFLPEAWPQRPPASTLHTARKRATTRPSAGASP
jgi:hypothetical protein